MIVFLNGPFGVGNSIVARLLAQRLPGPRLYDPEKLGTIVRAVVRPFKSVPDYQDLAVSPRLIPRVARIAAIGAAGLFVIPMTVWRRDYHAQFRDSLHRIDPDLHCFQFTAPEEVLRQRILSRPEAEGGHTWCLVHLAAGLAMALDPTFGIPLATDHRSAAEVASAIEAALQAARR